MPYDPRNDFFENTGEFLKDTAIITGKALWYTGKATYFTSKFLAKNGYKLYKHLADKNNGNNNGILPQLNAPWITNSENKSLIKLIRNNRQCPSNTNNHEEDKILKLLNHSPIKLPELNLNRETFLDYFISENKRLVFNNGKVYCYGKESQLEEISPINSLEKIFFDKNKKVINDFKNSSLDYLTSQNRELNAKIKALKHYSANDLLDNFILNYLIPLIDGREPTKITNIEEKEILNLNEKSIINHKEKSFLERFFSESYKQYQGFILFGKDISGIPKRDRLSKILKQNPNLDITNNCEHFSSGKEINNSYVNFIENKIKENFEKTTLPLINELNKKKSVLSNNRVPNRREGIYFERKSTSEYIIYKKLNGFAVKYGTEYFLFPKTNLGVRIISKDRDIKLMEKPFIYNDKNYKHPFVNPAQSKEKEICLGDANLDSFRNEFWKISQDTKDAIAKSILRVFQRTENILYNIRENNPNRTYCKIENSSAEKINQYELDSFKNKGVPIFGN